ncbi:MAG: hypothetical protein QOK42_281 [Frankiaceae bacterium]|nr:hypothetical protein [Frankiaceae bacterium]MDX6225345.1 hypothetical protein [Frankiales bacterium]MDX6273539.1 hypothetical protein [Frankiales bacterium]
MSVGVGVSLATGADGHAPIEPSVAAARSQLAARVRALLLAHGPLEPDQLADLLNTTTAHVMFAVRELEQLGLVAVEVPTPS